ncbi:hypothetical protein MPER_01710, partial [Moniliophthora perniciosa FA553]
LLALGLEIPEDTFVDMHNISAVGETYAIECKVGHDNSFPRTEDDDNKSKNVWLKGHTALQILSPDGKWRWVKHIENGAGGFYRATIHRVVQPAPEQVPTGVPEDSVTSWMRHKHYGDTEAGAHSTRDDS